MKLLNSYKNRKSAEQDVSKLMAHGIPSIVTGHEKMPKIFSDEGKGGMMVDIYVDIRAFPIATIIINDNTPLWQKVLYLIFKRRRKKTVIDSNSKEIIKD